MTKSKTQSDTPSQLLLSFFESHPRNHHGTPKLLKVSKIEPDPATPGREIRRLRINLGIAGRRLLYNDRQLLLGEDGEYWIARPRVDEERIETRLKNRIKREHGLRKRTDFELRVVEERGLLAAEKIKNLRSDWSTAAA